jgi:hypothetical protein
MKGYLALIIATAAAASQSEELAPWTQAERDSAIAGCARGIAEPAYVDYRKRNNLPVPDPDILEKVIELAIAPGSPTWTMCSCVMDEVAKRWKASALRENQKKIDALAIDLIDSGKCRPSN